MERICDETVVIKDLFEADDNLYNIKCYITSDTHILKFSYTYLYYIELIVMWNPKKRKYFIINTYFKYTNDDSLEYYIGETGILKIYRDGEKFYEGDVEVPIKQMILNNDENLYKFEVTGRAYIMNDFYENIIRTMYILNNYGPLI